MILDGSEFSFSTSLYLLDAFAYISGLKVNFDRTEALWIGVCKSSNNTLPTSKPIIWADRKPLYLVSLESTLGDKSLDMNFIEKIDRQEDFLSWVKSQS